MTLTLPTSTPSAEGVDPVGLTGFLDAMDATPEIELHSLMVLRHGKVVAEGWWAPYAPDRAHLLYSLSKSFTSTAAGFAAAEGLLDLDEAVLSYFPEFADDITDERSRRMLVRHVAAMASGHRAETLDQAIRNDPREVVRGFLLIPPDEEPGTVFAYNQPCTYTLAAIVQKLSGQSLTEYLRPRLFEPLGVDQYGWIQSPPGRDLGFSGLHATTKAIAHLGQLYLDRGRWAGEQLLPPEWVAEATRKQVDNPNEPNPDWRQGYGFQFWMARHGYRGDGAYGQFCVVLPEQDLVVAITADTENMQGILDGIWEHLLPAVGDPRSDSDGDTALAARLEAAALPPALGDPEPADADGWAGREFVVDPSVPQTPATLQGVRLHHGTDGWRLELLDDGGPADGLVGTGEWAIDNSSTPIAVSGGWTADRFRAAVIFLETPHRLLVECAGGQASARWRTAPLHQPPLRQLAAPRP